MPLGESMASIVTLGSKSWSTSKTFQLDEPNSSLNVRTREEGMEYARWFHVPLDQVLSIVVSYQE